MILKYKDKITSIIHKHLPGCKIYLFGLHPKEIEEDMQELEEFIALDAGFLIDQSVLGNIYDDIQQALIPIDLDIVDMHNISQELREKILDKGILF